MALSMLVALISAPALLGTQEAIRQSQSKEKREEHRARRCNLIASCVKSSLRSKDLNGRPVVLRNGKLWIDTGTSDGSTYGHPYAGYYLPYPDATYEGLVTTITDEAPIMNWVYVDKDTYEAKYGVRADAQPNFTGPFDCTRQDRRLTFDGWEGWCAVEEFPTLWALYFDKDDNGLQGKVVPGTRVLEIELTRKEKRWKNEAQERQEDQTTKRAVQTQQDAPVDKPITAEPDLTRPGAVDNPGVKHEAYVPFSMPKSIFAEPATSPPGMAYTAEVNPEEYKPFPIPKSIFAEPDPPARPQTPPPAYSVGFETVPPVTQTATTPSPTGFKASPSSTPEEKRITPKLNRSSGTKALAKAQMFEALSQKPNIDLSNRLRPKSRANDADSASVYSEERLSTGLPDAYTDQPDSSIPTPSAPTVVSKEPLQPPALVFEAEVLDPAVFGGNLVQTPVPSRREGSGSNSKIEPQRPLRREPSARQPLPKPVLPLLPSPSNSRSSEVSKQPSSNSKRADSAERSRDISLEVRRPPNTRQPTRALSRREPSASRSDGTVPNSTRSRGASASTRADSPNATRPRGASTSSREESPRPLIRTATTPAPLRRPMGATMTTGAMTSVARRMTPPNPTKPRSREKTNSSLYREIDDILQPGSSQGTIGKRTVGGSSPNTGSEERPLPLRRAATSRAPLEAGEPLGSLNGPKPSARREKRSSREIS